MIDAIIVDAVVGMNDSTTSALAMSARKLDYVSIIEKHE
jgi:hypothetical protein